MLIFNVSPLNKVAGLHSKILHALPRSNSDTVFDKFWEILDPPLQMEDSSEKKSKRLVINPRV